jgi:hypothetical protein
MLGREKDWGRFVSWLGSTNTPVCNPSPEGTDNSLCVGLARCHPPGKRFFWSSEAAIKTAA